MGPTRPHSCLQCHSADYRISWPTASPMPTGARRSTASPASAATRRTRPARPRAPGTRSSTHQLVGDPANPSDLCSTCHNSQIGDGVLTAGTTVYENQKEVMNGTGAIGVPQGIPGVHKGKCVECHMPPTSYSRGSAQLGGNHTFEIITRSRGGRPVPVTPRQRRRSPSQHARHHAVDSSMPYSACSTCHNKMPARSPQPIDTDAGTRSTTISARLTQVTVTRHQADQGDKGSGCRTRSTSVRLRCRPSTTRSRPLCTAPACAWATPRGHATTRPTSAG